MDVLGGHPMDPQETDLIGEGGVARSDGTAVTDSAEVLGRIEAVRSHRRAPGVDERPVSLGSVLDNRHAKVGDLGRKAVEVDDDDRLRPQTQCRPRRLAVEAGRLGIDVSKHGSCTDGQHGGGCWDRSKRRHDHLVPRADTENSQRQLQRRRARGDTDHVFSPDKLAKGLLKRPEFRPEQERSAACDPLCNRPEC